MHTMTRQRSALAWTWIACLAFLFNAFAPRHAMGAAAVAGAPAMAGIEVCTALGMKMVPWPDGAAADSADTGQAHKSMNHCAYCAAHTASHGLPPPMTALFVPGAGRDAWPPLYYRSSRILFPWALAQPRAPPFLS